jgi:hypothetical protein
LSVDIDSELEVIVIVGGINPLEVVFAITVLAWLDLVEASVLTIVIRITVPFEAEVEVINIAGKVVED